MSTTPRTDAQSRRADKEQSAPFHQRPQNIGLPNHVYAQFDKIECDLRTQSVENKRLHEIVIPGITADKEYYRALAATTQTALTAAQAACAEQREAILEAMNDICRFDSSALYWQAQEVPDLITPSPNFIHTHHKLKAALSSTFGQPTVDRLTAVDNQLSNLLARIHRDGGHYEQQHGREKALVDADLAVANAYANENQLAAAQARAKQLEAAHNEVVCCLRDALDFIWLMQHALAQLPLHFRNDLDEQVKMDYSQQQKRAVNLGKELPERMKAIAAREALKGEVS